MQGIGNDFVMVDAFRTSYPGFDWPALSRVICDRRFGVGSDGLILIEKGETREFRMRMFNPDGSESEMCGNGIRCYAKFVREHGLSDATTVAVETGAGVLELEIASDGRVKVQMGQARLTRGEIGMIGPAEERFVNQKLALDYMGTAVSMGNPHVVIFTSDVRTVDLERIGPELERHPYFPARVNVHFAQVLSRSEIRQRTWERGAGITLACGTGACAVGVAGFLNDHTDRRVLIHLPGGDLEIEFAESGEVTMTGPAETVFVGEWPAV
jgi:diaminopimelate epimerase